MFRWCEGGERTRKTALAPPSFSLRFLQRTQGSEAEVRSLQYQVQKPIKGVEERDFEERVHRQDVERVGRSSTTVSVRSSSLFSPSFLFFFLRSNALRLSISSIDEEPDSSSEQPTQLQRKQGLSRRSVAEKRRTGKEAFAITAAAVTRRRFGDLVRRLRRPLRRQVRRLLLRRRRADQVRLDVHLPSEPPGRQGGSGAGAAADSFLLSASGSVVEQEGTRRRGAVKERRKPETKKNPL